MNIIFLDVDGVLNSINNLIRVYNETKKPHSGSNYPFDNDCMENFKNLVLETNSKIVISSTWRKYSENIKKLMEELKKYDLDKYVIGCTPNLNIKREFEILCYLYNMNENDNIHFIVLDDDDMPTLSPFLIKTNNITGLTDANVEEAKDKLLINKKTLLFDKNCSKWLKKN